MPVSIARTSATPPASPTVRATPVSTTASSAQPAMRENRVTSATGAGAPAARRSRTSRSSGRSPPIHTPIARKCTHCAISAGNAGMSAAAWPLVARTSIAAAAERPRATSGAPLERRLATNDATRVAAVVPRSQT